MSEQRRFIATAIPFRVVKGSGGANKLEFYLHTRFKPKVSPFYSSLLEFPVGGVDAGEDTIDAVLRELLEETGLEGTHIYPPQMLSTQLESRGDVIFGGLSFYNLEMLVTSEGMIWSGPVYLIKVNPNSEVNINQEEAKDPQWLNLDQLKKLFAKEQFEKKAGNLDIVKSSFFELHIPVFRFLMSKLKDEKFRQELLDLGEKKESSKEFTSEIKRLKPNLFGSLK
jgi:8-oxo-dGTP pyrophosphatase MutT (NUDIX family)